MRQQRSDVVVAWRIQRLSREHRQLEEEIADLEARMYLSDDDQRRRQELKKAKLAAKDELQTLQDV